MKCSEVFLNIYGREANDMSFCPYRVCPIGAHSDHQLGHILGFAIDKGIYMSYSPKTNGVIELVSLQFDKRAQWHINAIPDKQNDWADYLRGATLALSKLHPLTVGISGVIEGTLPIGGLSSSAAVIICFLKALIKVNNITLSNKELIEIALSGEKDYVGVSCGKLDQSCEVYSKKNNLLFLDTKDDSYELIPIKETMKPFKIAIFFSGIERNLAGSAFNMRVDECRSAAYSLKALANMPYGKFEETNLRDVPREVYEEYKDKLPLNFKKRAEHWYTEYDRVSKGAEAFKNGDIEEFGRLIFESGLSSINNWETGSKELITLYNIMTKTKGIYGGRFSGAGFKGCCMALIDPDYEKEILGTVEKEYLKVFPELKGKYSQYIANTADGVGL